MLNKMDRRVCRTQNRIRLALIELLSEKNRQDITVKELAIRADINRKTFYTHFDNIDDMFSKLESEIIDKLLIILDSYDFFDSEFKANELLKMLNKVIYDDFSLYENLIKSDSHEFLFCKMKKVLKDNLIDKYTSMYDFDPILLTFYIEYVASGFMSMYFEWFRSNRIISLEELGQAASLIILSGINSITKRK